MMIAEESSRRTVCFAALETLAVLAVFALHGAWPAPDVNEPHYVFKALHYWRPDALPGDFFLQSRDAHVGFYALVGWVTLFVSPTAAAWIGRFAAWTALAIGWQRLSRTLAPKPGLALLSATLVVAGHEWCHMAGEWVVGGFEAKPFAYAAALLAVSEFLRSRYLPAGLWLGASITLHVLVGGWTLVALALATLLERSLRGEWSRAAIVGVVAVGMSIVPSVWPALTINRGTDPTIVAEAQRIYVFERLRHHLVPDTFPAAFHERHALLWCVWIALVALRVGSSGLSRWRAIMLGTLVITLAGIVIRAATFEQPELAASLLRYYWFRLSDALLPMGVALEIITRLDAPRRSWSRGQHVLAAVALSLALAHVGWLVRQRVDPPAPRADKPGRVIDPGDWRDACHWIAAHTPTDAVFLTPRSSVSFRWYAARADVGTWKDIPQDATHVVEWWRRMQMMHATGSQDPEDRWFDSLAEAGAEHVQRMGRALRATHLLTAADPPLPWTPVYRNASYAIYALPPFDERASP